MPKIARALGLSGLLPLLAVVLVLFVDDDPANRRDMLGLGLLYAALILSFLGGLWWGLAAAAQRSPPGWVWGVAVVPSLYVWVPLGLVWLGLMAPAVALGIIGAGLWMALLVDRALVRLGLAPGWWMRLRVPLSLGLGGLSMAAAALY